jgi:hypothetical protein
MDIALKITGLIALIVVIVILVWGFILFYNFVMDTKKQNMMLYSIIEKLTTKSENNIHSADR